jgi:hypothetical protein
MSCQHPSSSKNYPFDCIALPAHLDNTTGPVFSLLRSYLPPSSITKSVTVIVPSKFQPTTPGLSPHYRRALARTEREKRVPNMWSAMSFRTF